MNSAGVVACGHFFAAIGGSYLALDIFPKLRWSLHELFKQAAVLQVVFFDYPNRTTVASPTLLYRSGTKVRIMIWHSLPAIERTALINLSRSGSAFPKLLGIHGTRLIPDTLLFKNILESICISV